MLILKPTQNNLLNKFNTVRKIKEKLKKRILPAVENKLALRDILYEKVTINDLFN